MEFESKAWGKFSQYLSGIFVAKRGKKKTMEKNRKKIT